MDSSDGVVKLVALALLVVVALGGGAVAQTGEPAWAEGTAASLERLVDDHNAAVATADLGPAARLVRDQRVSLAVTATDGSVAQFSFRTDAAARVVEFRTGPREDATVRMFTDPATVERVADSPDRTAAFEAAVRVGDVRIEGVGLLNRAAWALVGLVLWALSSPIQAAAVGAAVLVGAGVLVALGTNVVGGAGGAVGGIGGAGAVGGAEASATAVGTGGPGTQTVNPGSSAGVSTPEAETLSQTGANTMTAGASFNPVGLADRLLSFFERALFIVAIAKNLWGRLRRGFGAVVVGVLARFGFARLTDEEGDERPDKPVTDVEGAPTRPRIRRRGVPRRRRRRRGE